MVQRLASLRLTLAALGLALAALLWARIQDERAGSLLTFAFAVLFINLLAALATNPKLYRQFGLLVFHLGLALLALAAAIGQMFSLEGHVEVTQGSEFDPAHLVASIAAPFHPWSLRQTRFLQGPFTIDYLPGMKRQNTRSQVTLLDDGEQGRTLEVGDDIPLVIGSYRLYTTANKGYAPVLTWTEPNGETITGAVHLPSFPVNYDRQGADWIPPGSKEPLVLWLELPDPMFDPDKAWRFAIPETARLAVTQGQERTVLAPGEEMSIGAAKLRYEKLTGWMGYAIFYDPTLPWLFASSVVAILGLAWHVIRRFLLAASTPWETGQDAH